MKNTRSIFIRVKSKVGRVIKGYSRNRNIRASFTSEEAQKIAEKLGINFSKEKFDLSQFTMGINVELEHGSKDPQTDVTKNNPILTGKIAWAHLKEFPDYYTRLKKLEEEAKAYWNIRKCNVAK